MSSLNQVLVLGNLGADPETRVTAGGVAITRLSVATSRKYQDRDQNWVEETEWHRVTVFGKTAEACGRFLRKGRQVVVQGRLKTSSYEKDGITRYSTEIIAEQVTFIGGAPGGGRSERREEPRRESGGGGGLDPSSTGDLVHTPPDDDIPF